MGANNNLKIAKAKKDDEFYTRIEDIEKEVFHYKEHFFNKTVYCNCDDPEWSNFFIYFRNNFKFLGLKKLISTHYSVDVKKDKAYKLECVEYVLGEDGLPVPKRIDLKGDGDFRSEECIAFLQESDIVCTNPPFSLFREYVAQLVKYEKKFLIIGNTNAITYKETFGLIKNGQIWLGNNSVKEFRKPNGEMKKFGNICWLTNLTHKKMNEELILWKDYSENEYIKYDNFDAIEVSKTNEIPKNYNGLMGVPITFLTKYNPNQFEIVGLFADKRDADPIYIKGRKTYLDENHKSYVGAVLNGKATYARIIIKTKKGNK